MLAAPNTYKESLTAMEACQAIGAGVRAACPRAEVRMAPLADGGDGTIQALVDATGGRLIQTEARDPLGRAVRAPIGRLGDEATFVVEMAQASGLWMLTPAERNPLKTSTVGTGDCLRAALDRGAKRILVGIGGSATNDGGAGMARALGYGLLDADGNPKDAHGAYADLIADGGGCADPVEEPEDTGTGPTEPQDTGTATTGSLDTADETSDSATETDSDPEPEAEDGSLPADPELADEW